jgi:hypothetical protein
MSKDHIQDDYEIGYRKPPRNTQFQKGISGNPKGRPKKSLDFDHELIRESLSLITITDNGQRKRISKIQGITKQLTNKALTGSSQALRIYLEYLQQALERAAQSTPQQSIESLKCQDPATLTDEQLRMLISDNLRDRVLPGVSRLLKNSQ